MRNAWHGDRSPKVGPTPDAILVKRAGSPRAPVRAIGRTIVDDDYGWITRFLTCGHVASGKARKDGRHTCYACQVEIAREILAKP